MKVHPLPRKRNFTTATTVAATAKKLRRLPHVFSRVLELPFTSNTDVLVSETEDCFKFIAESGDIGVDVRADMVEAFPGVMKIVVKKSGFVVFDEFELDVWRCRLPESIMPELATAVCVDGELVVTVPKAKDAVGWLLVVQ